MLEIKLRPLFTIKIEVDAPMTLIGQLPHGPTRRIAAASGGWFEGERLAGKVLAGGGDAVLERPDGGLILDVRLTLQTTDGENIFMTYAGRRNGPPHLLERIRRRDPIEPGSDYFRVAAQFETGAPGLRWLNDIIAVGAGTREPNGPRYDIYEVL